MITDYFTKPLQGSHFRRFRNTIMGLDEVDIPGYNKHAIELRNIKLQKLQAKESGLTKNTPNG